MPETDTIGRFSGRAEYYRRFRPGYPDEVFDYLQSAICLVPDSVVVDIGSGPGTSALLFLRRGHRVYGVEPNAEMRAMAQALVRQFPRFSVCSGTAESTGLPDHSADLIVAGSACHWFDVPLALHEFRRVLKPTGALALLGNRRRKDSALMAACQAVGRRYSRPGGMGERAHDLERLAEEFMGAGNFASMRFAHDQVLELEGFLGCQLSYSTSPLLGQEGHNDLIRELTRVFTDHQSGGVVRLQYYATVCWGRIPVNRNGVTAL